MKLARTAAAIFCSLIIAVPAYASYPPDQVITMKGNYVITGDLYVDSLLGHIGECLEVGMQGQIIPTGAVCGGGGGGGVTSVTSSNANLTSAPTTGAVILGFASSPNFSGGTVTADTFIQDNAAAIGSLPIATWFDAEHSKPVVMSSSGAANIESISGDAFGITENGTDLAVLDQNGNFAVSGSLAAASLTPGQCLTATGSRKIISTGSPCAAGGGVTSVTAGLNMVVSPNTGAVIVNTVEDPQFTGFVSTTTVDEGLGFLAGPVLSGGSTNVPRAIAISNTLNAPSNTNIGTDSTTTIAGINGALLTIYDYTSGLHALAIDGTGDLGVAGSLSAGSLAASVGDCLEAAANGQIVSTGSACGGAGAVTSVTSADAGFITAAPTTGAVVLNIASSPSLLTKGTLSIDSLADGGGASFGGAIALPAISSNQCLENDGGQHMVGTGSPCATGSVTSVTSANALISVTNPTTTPVLTGNESPTFTGAATFNSSITGNSTLFVTGLATVGNLTDTALTASSPVCTNGSSTLTTGGCTATPQIQHGHQTITAASGTCVAGTPVTFSPTMSAAPDITFGTSAIVGDTGAVSAPPLTTGFTPEVCSVASNAAVTVYWTAVN